MILSFFFLERRKPLDSQEALPWIIFPHKMFSNMMLAVSFLVLNVSLSKTQDSWKLFPDCFIIKCPWTLCLLFCCLELCVLYFLESGPPLLIFPVVGILMQKMYDSSSVLCCVYLRKYLEIWVFLFYFFIVL